MALLQIQRRRALRVKNGIFSVSANDIKKLFYRQNHECFWCNNKLITYHIDHVIPLQRGGRHSIGNLVISCPSCNSRKNNKLPIEFKMMNNKIQLTINPAVNV